MTISLSNPSTLYVTSGSLPAWVPPPGTYGKVPMTNSYFDLEPNPAVAWPPGTRPPGYADNWEWGPIYEGSMTHFAGAAFAPDYSPLGAYLIGCGGGNDWLGNQVTVCDLSSLTYSYAVDPSVYALREPGLTFGQYYERASADWRDFADESPIAGHHYTVCQYLPASWGVTGARGAFWFGTPTHSKRRVTAHICDLSETPRRWHRFGPVSADGNFGFGLEPYPGAVRDDLRQCFYWMAANAGGDGRRWRYSKDGTLTQFLNGGLGSGIGGTVACISYCPLKDVMIGSGSNTPTLSPIRVIRADTWQTAVMVESGTRPTFTGGNGISLEWDPDRGCFGVWNPLTETFYKLFPPAGDPLTGTWTWTQEVIAKAPAPYTPVKWTVSAGGLWNKLRYVPAIKCYIIRQDKPNELHVIRPSGA